MTVTRRAVFLDRDGVLSASLFKEGRPTAPTRFVDFVLLPGVPEALRTLKDAGYALVVVTNQPDVATGQLPLAELEKMHALLRAALPLDAIKICIHTDRDSCACRKPKPGMLLEGARELSLDLNRSYMVGDRWRDIEAGKAAGCRTILIGDGYGEKEIHPDLNATSLPDAARHILKGGSEQVIS